MQMKKISLLLTVVCLLAACGQKEQAGGESTPAFPELTDPYRAEKAIENGDVVNVHGRIANWERWEQFLKNVDQQTPDQVRITSYTIEGDPTFEELVYDGKKVVFTYDNSMDKYGGKNKGRQMTTCEGITIASKSKGKNEYILKGCDKEFGQYFELSN
ncbi:DUF4362 domain-containing protein [Brevibacillus nitrificans]|uniref:DUF4362 domain-containing protein n=1 Tax=Brevibacillus nitrificans TaxID=651560 RepID=UPI002863564F|nr:DUF4362 domain-containing protein [Brevibacillus nitrificans]MDR7315606.1 hypothetical protein [Brevibacillus nitrificans]